MPEETFPPMLATVSNLPKWLLAAVVFCLVLGHCQQAECRLSGCHAVAVDAGAKNSAKGDPAAADESGHCDCQCHFSVAPFEVPHSFSVLRFARQVRVIERTICVPEVPCAEIEYPPKSVRA